MSEREENAHLSAFEEQQNYKMKNRGDQIEKSRQNQTGNYF